MNFNKKVVVFIYSYMDMKTESNQHYIKGYIFHCGLETEALECVPINHSVSWKSLLYCRLSVDMRPLRLNQKYLCA